MQNLMRMLLPSLLLPNRQRYDQSLLTHIAFNLTSYLLTQSGAVRTKYDRMFERKNQNILSEHYSKLIEHSDVEDDEGDDFITLKRADHDLPENGPLDPNDVSKRKLKMGMAKRTIVTGGNPKKIIFDDQGKPHEMYEMADVEEVFREKGGFKGVKEEGKKFAEGERGRMRVADVVDKEEAKDKKREKKRKRKDRENEVGDLIFLGYTFAHFLLLQVLANNGLGQVAVVAPVSENEDDGYVSPDFDLPSGDEEEEFYTAPPPSKRAKTSNGTVNARSGGHTIEDDEELALQLLRNR